ncbi:MAG: LysR family transcriptional regulator [Gammaproteobacteria bacterium]|nr:MAG: LysR family transcriptional regulator [Gammaproteobacteria bacterium]
MTTGRLKNLDLGTLRSFVTIADAGSMTRAASRLFLTQSAISMQIKRLESSLGFSVLERSAQGMTPTAEGEQLLHFANQMLALNDEAMGRLTSPDFEGQIRLGVPGDVIYPHIPLILREFSRDYPRVQVKLSSAQTFTLKHEFQQGSQDIVLTTEKAASPGGRVISTQPLVWTGAAEGVAWKKRPLPLGFAKICAFKSGVTKALDDAGIDWVDIVASGDAAASEAMTSADLCVTAELESAIHSSRVVIDHGGQLPELPEHSIVLYSNDSPGNQITQTLVEYLLRAYT